MIKVQFNLSTMATVGTEESGHCKEVAVLERFQTRVDVWIFCPLGQNKVACRKEVALAKVRVYLDILKRSCLNKFYINVHQASVFTIKHIINNFKTSFNMKREMCI